MDVRNNWIRLNPKTYEVIVHCVEQNFQRMIDIGDTEDNQKELNRKNNVPSTEGFLASPERHQRLVPALWKKYPVQKGSSGVLVGNGKTLAMPVFVPVASQV